MGRPPTTDARPDEPRDELDVANRFVAPTTYDELLEKVNLGTGFYQDEDISLQLRNFRKGLIADTAFDGRLWDRAVYETKIKLADEGFSWYNEHKDTVEHWPAFEELSENEYEGGRTAALRERGDEIWSSLGDPHQALSDSQAAALSEKASLQTFKPVFWRLLAAYHEASKSKGARTQDNFFQRVKKVLDDSSASQQSKNILLGGRS